MGYLQEEDIDKTTAEYNDGWEAIDWLGERVDCVYIDGYCIIVMLDKDMIEVFDKMKHLQFTDWMFIGNASVTVYGNPNVYNDIKRAFEAIVANKPERTWFSKMPKPNPNPHAKRSKRND